MNSKILTNKTDNKKCNRQIINLDYNNRYLCHKIEKNTFNMNKSVENTHKGYIEEGILYIKEQRMHKILD